MIGFPLRWLLAGVLALGLATTPSIGWAGSSRDAAARAKAGEDAQPPMEPVALRDGVIVNDDYVTLGDLFTGTGARASAVVAYAPEPGQVATFDARWLYRLARAKGLDWKPMGLRDRIVVRRDSRIIGRQQIEEKVSERLGHDGVDGPLEAELNERTLRIYLPGDVTPTVGVEDLSFDDRTRRFTATVVAPAGQPSAERVRVSGRYYRLAEVPVLVRRKIAGEIIQADDVTIETMRVERLPRDAVSEPEQLIGQEVRRGLVPGKPVRVAEVQKPILVPKGSLVTVVVHAPAMTLTTRGKALEAGSLGDVIRISNLQSKTTLEAVVSGAGAATVQPASRLAIN